MAWEMDDKDRQILTELRRDAGQTTTQLAKRLGMPRTTVHEREQRLLSEGVIRRKTVMVDHAKLGQGVTAFILVRFEHGSEGQRTLAKRIGELPGVSEVFVITGEWDILVKVRAPGLQEMGGLVLDELREMAGVAGSMTMASFETVKEEV